MNWFLATEDALSNALGKKILSHCYQNLPDIHSLGLTGFGRIRSDLRDGKFTRLAQTYPVLVLTDLDQRTCAPSMRSEWCQGIHIPAKLIFRIVVRESESWLMADKTEFSRFFGIPISKITAQVEQISSPKEHLLGLVDRYGNKESKKILPPKGSKAVTSPLYNSVLIQFIENHWSPHSASVYSKSLKKALDRISHV